MFLKPRATQKNPQATVYRHYLEQVDGMITLQDDLNVDYDVKISEYQLNKYYRYKDFDYVITSNEDTSEVQYEKGLIVEETTFDIKYFNDSLGLLQDNDLVKIGNRIYQVENPVRIKKRMPKPYYVYTCTLKSVL